MSSAGDLAFVDAPPLEAGPATAATVEIATAFRNSAGHRGGVGGPRPPPLGPRCSVWFAGDGRRAAVCWPGAGGGGGGGGGRVAGGGLGGARSAGAGGSVVGLLTLGTAEEAVESRVRRGLLGEALDLAVSVFFFSVVYSSRERCPCFVPGCTQKMDGVRTKELRVFRKKTS